ncbi:MAG: Uma2 family endonuclease [Armatimonadetes bacterium]|nr:Uma2 family endonuclease [Armatimonadota bacterium]
MSEVAQSETLITPEEYLAGELAADVRSEYVGGRLFPMPGTSDTHNELNGNLVHALIEFVGDGPCRVYFCDLKFRSRGGHVFYYPDVMVCCDPNDNARYWRDRPRYVFEISSPETQRDDERDKKLTYYFTPSIESYVQIAQDRLHVIVNRRTPDLDFWTEETLTHPDDLIRLDSLDFSLPLSRLYRRTGLLDA